MTARESYPLYGAADSRRHRLREGSQMMFFYDEGITIPTHVLIYHSCLSLPYFLPLSTVAHLPTAVPTYPTHTPTPIMPTNLLRIHHTSRSQSRADR